MLQSVRPGYETRARGVRTSGALGSVEEALHPKKECRQDEPS
jgi:hypothetical protein